MKVMVYALVLATSLIAVGAVQARPVQIPLWQTYDFGFRSSTPHENPFLVDFKARVTGPDGRELVIPGFYDGKGVWKIRFSPMVKGKWTLVTSSSDPELNDIEMSDITAVDQPNAKIRGALKIDPEHPRHFMREDGSRFFLMGYECDWLWAVDAGKSDLPVINRFLDKLADYGFNYIIMNFYAHDTPWCKGRSNIYDYGPPSIYPWEGTNDAPVFDRLNLEFWQHYDRVLATMSERGMIAHVMTKVYNKMVNWPKPLSAEEDLFYRTLVARYAAYPNVVWDFSKEAHNERDFEYKAARLRAIRELDPYRRLMTVHDDSGNYDRGAYDEILDYRSDQQHSDWHKTIMEQRAMREWPVVNVEFGYEWGLKGEHTYPVTQSPKEVVMRAWEVYTAGGYGAYYYTNTAWDVIKPVETPPGYGYFKNLRSFFEGTRYWVLEPHDELLERGHCLANPGKEYVVYHGEPGEFTLEIAGAKRPLAVEWYHPLTGKREAGQSIGNGKQTLRTPDGWEAPIALHVCESAR